ncbi:uncharacterized protein UDID_18919 [Ustilago sp. UG-2017a]|nr:uncharacterized protein UDID_18919 [Ustilago sp. UG-2017a]
MLLGMQASETRGRTLSLAKGYFAGKRWADKLLLVAQALPPNSGWLSGFSIDFATPRRRFASSAKSEAVFQPDLASQLLARQPVRITGRFV